MCPILIVVVRRPRQRRKIYISVLEDMDGMINVVVPLCVYKRFQQILKTARLLVVAGAVQHETGAINVLASHFASLDRV